MKALVVTQPGSVKDHLQILHVDEPNPGEQDIIIKVHAAAVNPLDWKMAKLGFMVSAFPHRLGSDVSGLVTKVGPRVTEFKPGDAVYGKTTTGGFAEYTALPAMLAVPKPTNLSHTQAATLPVAISTAALGLFHPSVGLGLAPPSSHTAYFKPENSEYVTSLGAAHVFDSSLPPDELISKVKNVTLLSGLQYALDCISPDTTSTLAARALKQGGSVVTITGPADVPRGIKLLVLGAGEPSLQPVQIIENGLQGLPDALELSSNGKVSGVKLVVPLVSA
ncbi:hypothetical protein SeMB42_g01157 [Synchytrium endobioticum]|uniref:Enoyl reductase (ER) domain-containing protein n=1 Tax=Synchytrium endobioticum TaxID=286115 RepID=A0A507DMD0_9FUNG|nr:hypothetical protein SeLEV6574_g06988 [Synchytrium endobioticum]TPX52824.1 hypothetical protein SeMB42_g01157 [Synchytrium endobioticum]